VAEDQAKHTERRRRRSKGKRSKRKNGEDKRAIITFPAVVGGGRKHGESEPPRKEKRTIGEQAKKGRPKDLILKRMFMSVRKIAAGGD